MSVLWFSFFWCQQFTQVELCKLQLGINHSITAVLNKYMQKISGFQNIYAYNLNDYKIIDYNGPDHTHWERWLILERYFSNVGALKCDEHLILKRHKLPVACRIMSIILFSFAIFVDDRGLRKLCLYTFETDPCAWNLSPIVMIVSRVRKFVFKLSPILSLHFSYVFELPVTL